MKTSDAPNGRCSRCGAPVSPDLAAKGLGNRSVPVLVSLLLGLARLSQVLAICAGLFVTSRYWTLACSTLNSTPRP